MLTWTCEQVRGELSAFRDQELAVEDRIAIADHLESCASCRLEDNDLETISDAFQVAVRVESADVMTGLGRLQTDILERWNAEERVSLSRTIHNLLDDPGRASASLGASIVASVCLAICALILTRGPIGHPESLKAAMTLSERARVMDIYLPSVELPRANAEAIMPAAVVNGDNEEVAFAALVRADGYLEELEFLGEHPLRRPAQASTHEELLQLLNAVATARFEPARQAGAPVSQNVVWLLSHTTVRAPLRAYVHVRVDGWKTL